RQDCQLSSILIWDGQMTPRIQSVEKNHHSSLLVAELSKRLFHCGVEALQYKNEQSVFEFHRWSAALREKAQSLFLLVLPLSESNADKDQFPTKDLPSRKREWYRQFHPTIRFQFPWLI